jgi:threonyl-tRNA synthetase
MVDAFSFLDRPFWMSPRQVLVIPVAAPYVRSLVLGFWALSYKKCVLFNTERVRVRDRGSIDGVGVMG